MRSSTLCARAALVAFAAALGSVVAPAAVGAGAAGDVVRVRSTPDALPVVAIRDLPAEAREVLVLIVRGGPFQHERDGVVFGNRERILPAGPRGYYREYTVRTPGERTRGARRIVCGGARTAPDACFYTDDHYNSFRRILRNGAELRIAGPARASATASP